MNFNITHLPNRASKPRKNGLTMMMDKGLSIRQVEDFIETAGHLTDLVKFGFGTSIISTNLEQKIKLYQEADISVYFGGTLFEAYIARDMFDDYKRILDKYNIEKLKPLVSRLDHYVFEDLINGKSVNIELIMKK